jgi:NADH:ubiquinone oxidoreductase subunit D
VSFDLLISLLATVSISAASQLSNSPQETSASAMNGRESELEAQITELLDTLEILTLDKEQLVVDNELLQARIEEIGQIKVGEKFSTYLSGFSN